ncbi:MAG TPA: hypothetical protein VIH38_10100, partial [Steroidobacteraceae bacterium]
ANASPDGSPKRHIGLSASSIALISSGFTELASLHPARLLGCREPRQRVGRDDHAPAAFEQIDVDDPAGNHHSSPRVW